MSTQFILHLGYLSLSGESTDTETEYLSIRYVDFGMGVNNIRCKSSLYVLHLVLRSTRHTDKNPQIDNDQDHLHSTHKWNIQTNASEECELSAHRGRRTKRKIDTGFKAIHAWVRSTMDISSLRSIFTISILTVLYRFQMWYISIFYLRTINVSVQAYTYMYKYILYTYTMFLCLSTNKNQTHKTVVALVCQMF